MENKLILVTAGSRSQLKTLELVDERRASVGLGTLAEDEARIKATYAPSSM